MSQRRDSAELEDQKLRLEIAFLHHQLSRRAAWLEWTKAATGPVAVFGLVASVILGALQIRTATQARLEDRYQKEVAHLGSGSAAERLTGVAGLDLIVSDDSEWRRHREAVSFLANELGVEKDPAVRAALLRALHKLASRKFQDASVLSEAVALLVASNRALTRAHEFQAEELIRESAEKSVEIQPLVENGDLIAHFVRNGAREKDMSGISCIGCDFSGPSVNLSGVDFSNAILADSDFSMADLRAAKFADSILTNTKFWGAHLQRADLTVPFLGPRDYVGESRRLKLWEQTARLLDPTVTNGPAAVQMWEESYATFPDFTCADLTGRSSGVARSLAAWLNAVRKMCPPSGSPLMPFSEARIFRM